MHTNYYPPGPNRETRRKTVKYLARRKAFPNRCIYENRYSTTQDYKDLMKDLLKSPEVR